MTKLFNMKIMPIFYKSCGYARVEIQIKINRIRSFIIKEISPFFNFCQPNNTRGSYFVLSATLPQHEYSIFRSRRWICLGTLLGNAATHRRHRVLVHNILHTPVRHQFTITLTSAERRRCCPKGKGYIIIPICWFVCLLAILRENAWTDFIKVAG